jgi:aryl-alcohol dehydrogenase (NADP+)
MARLGRTDLDIFPLCLGGNVFGWTANEQESFAILDAYRAAGGNFIDTADSYSAWVPGHVGGESETIIGRWMKARGNRNQMIIATKVGRCPGRLGLTAKNIRAGAEASLERLGVDHIDLYYSHADDPATPMEESLRAFDALVREGKLRYVAASNFTAARLADALALSAREGLARYVALQPHYNLMVRNEYEGPLSELCAREGVACLPYFALAMGFLTGKYRTGVAVQSARAEGARAYLDARGLRVLAELDDLAAAHRSTVAAVALAWLLAQPTVAAPIASARTVDQLRDLLPMATTTLTAEESTRLDAASRA